MKNKVMLIGFLALFIGLGAKADPVTFESAKQMATRFYSVQMQLNGAKSLPDFTCVYPKNGKSVAAVPYYIFNAGEDQGFVIVAGDDNATRPVLGYSDKGRFEMENMPDNVRFWLDFYAQTMDLAAQSGIKAAAPADFSKVEVVKGPLLDKISYNQDAPYNELCPMDPNTGRRSYSGCVATALSMVACYYQYPKTGQGSITYTSNGRELSMDFSQNTYDWDNILEEYNGRLSSYTQEQRTAIATLMRDMGYAVKMNYTSNASGAVRDNTVVGVVDYMGFDSVLNYRERDMYDNDEQWKAVLKTNIDNNQPIYYSGYGDGGGHAFVCDGYDEADYFHFNWGWGGLCDGYFVVENLDPESIEGIGAGTGGGYTSNQGILHNLVPPGHSHVQDLYLLTTTHSIEAVQVEDSLYPISANPLMVNFRGFNNTSMSSFKGVVALAAFKEGEFVKVISNEEQLQVGRRGSKTVSFSLQASLESLDAGEYEIWTVCKSEVEGASWEKVYAQKANKYTNDSYIPVSLSDEGYKLLKTTATVNIRMDCEISRNIDMYIYASGQRLGKGSVSPSSFRPFSFRYGSYELRFWTRGYDTTYVDLKVTKDTSLLVPLYERFLTPYIQLVRPEAGSAVLFWLKERPGAEIANPIGYVVYLDSVEVARVDASVLNYRYASLDTGTYVAGLRAVYATGESDMVTRTFRVRTVGVDNEAFGVANCRLIPNPSATGYFMVETAQSCRLQVFDFSGKSLFALNLNPGFNRVDMSAYPAGVYLFRFIGKNGKTVTMKAILKE